MPLLDDIPPKHLRRLGVALGIALIVVGGARLFAGAVRPAVAVLLATRWEQVPVLSGGVLTSETIWEPLRVRGAHYSYVVRGRLHTGARYAFMHPMSYLHGRELRILSEQRFTHCYVNPSDPTDVVLVRELPLGAYRFSGLFFVLLGAALIAWCKTRSPWRTLPDWWLRAFAFAVAGTVVGWAVTSPAVGVFAFPVACLALAGFLLVWQGRRWVLIVLASGSVLLASVPFLVCSVIARYELHLDDIHEPGFAIDHYLGWVGGSLTVLTAAYMSWVLAWAMGAATRRATPKQ